VCVCVCMSVYACVCVRVCRGKGERETGGVSSPLNCTEAFIEERSNPTRRCKVNIKRLDESRSIGLARQHRGVHDRDHHGARARQSHDTQLQNLSGVVVAAVYECECAIT